MDTSNRPAGETEVRQDEQITRLSYILGAEKQSYTKLTADEWLAIIRSTMGQIEFSYLSDFKPLKDEEFSEISRSGALRLIPPGTLQFCATYSRNTLCRFVAQITKPFGYEIDRHSPLGARPHSQILVTREGQLVQWTVSYVASTALPRYDNFHIRSPYDRQKASHAVERVTRFEFISVTDDVLRSLLVNNLELGNVMFAELANMVHQTIEDRENRLKSLTKLKTSIQMTANRMGLYLHFKS